MTHTSETIVFNVFKALNFYYCRQQKPNSLHDLHYWQWTFENHPKINFEHVCFFNFFVILWFGTVGMLWYTCSFFNGKMIQKRSPPPPPPQKKKEGMKMGAKELDSQFVLIMWLFFLNSFSGYPSSLLMRATRIINTWTLLQKKTLISTSII